MADAPSAPPFGQGRRREGKGGAPPRRRKNGTAAEAAAPPFRPVGGVAGGWREERPPEGKGEVMFAGDGGAEVLGWSGG